MNTIINTMAALESVSIRTKLLRTIPEIYQILSLLVEVPSARRIRSSIALNTIAIAA